jgi:hypothetical protein
VHNREHSQSQACAQEVMMEFHIDTEPVEIPEDILAQRKSGIQWVDFVHFHQEK